MAAIIDAKKSNRNLVFLLAMINTLLTQRLVASFAIRRTSSFAVRNASVSASPTTSTTSFVSSSNENGILSVPAYPAFREQLGFRFGRGTFLSMSTDASQEEDTDVKTTYDVGGLKKEAQRLTLRCIKKVGKASQRLSKGNEIAEELRTDPNATDEQLQACPDIRSMEEHLEGLRDRLRKLNILEEKLQEVKNGKKVVLEEDIVALIVELEVPDAPPAKQPRGPGKKKGPKKVAPRMPYFKYYSQNKTEIRVGRRSEDNDELSCNPKHRDGPDWWMHASGCPGSHIVIRCHDSQLDKDVLQDAAALAARQSKCQGSTIKVSLTRCRDVKKPPGAKPGLVSLTGKVQTVSVNMKEAEKRLQRLDDTKI